jgi:hypothetical protein
MIVLCRYVQIHRLTVMHGQKGHRGTAPITPGFKDNADLHVINPTLPARPLVLCHVKIHMVTVMHGRQGHRGTAPITPGFKENADLHVINPTLLASPIVLCHNSMISYLDEVLYKFITTTNLINF